jgi:hypothetical protein
MAQVRNEKKAQRERAIFLRFVRAACPDIDPATIESRPPPEPDISCATFIGHGLAFELAELCPPDVAKAISDDLKRGRGATFVRTADPTQRILVNKLRKRYVSAVAVDLLCYADGLLVTSDDVVLDVMRETIGAEGFGSFRSIWFLGEDGGVLVAPS